MKANSLEERLVLFASNCVGLQKQLYGNEAGLFYGKQLMRSAGSAALNYGEAQAAESRHYPAKCVNSFLDCLDFYTVFKHNHKLI